MFGGINLIGVYLHHERKSENNYREDATRVVEKFQKGSSGKRR
jgi:hypothetical protein